ncbi:hypothetical protein Vafri_21825 [Volvox africanus]|uniref:Methyltransferase domain-containing protein n=1 Tax=Volvox africanus TaxID=51714 RepID=A0A8J4BTQ6_9CHLO|nr:hypothetical protein Vafri_21825 [Volvox africanus]
MRHHFGQSGRRTRLEGGHGVARGRGNGGEFCAIVGTRLRVIAAVHFTTTPRPPYQQSSTRSRAFAFSQRRVPLPATSPGELIGSRTAAAHFGVRCCLLRSGPGGEVAKTDWLPVPLAPVPRPCPPALSPGLRPQKFVRDLVLRRCFSGRVLDAGCGIGDNALYVAKAAPGASVTAVDVVARCLEFAAAKADLRSMRSRVELVVADMLQENVSRMPPELGHRHDGSFSVVLDSSTFHCFSDSDRERYVATLRRLLRPRGLIYMNCMSEEETRPGGPRRISVPDLLTVFNRPNGWEVETIEDSIIEVHPTFWGGQAKARLFTIRKL